MKTDRLLALLSILSEAGRIKALRPPRQINP